MWQLPCSSEVTYVEEYLKYPWDSEYKYTVENVTPHRVSAALKSHCARSCGGDGDAAALVVSPAISSQQRSRGEFTAGEGGKQMLRVSRSDLFTIF